MKKIIVSFFGVLITVFSLSSCSTSTDPIWGVAKVDSTFAFNFPLQQFHELGMKGDTVGQKRLYLENKAQLDRNVLKHYPCVKDVKSISYALGSGMAERVRSGDGKLYSGKFKNELIIMVNDSCKKDTVFLACGNGMLTPLKLSSSMNWGNPVQCRFEIKPGQGLAHYKPQLEEWAKTSGQLEIPIKNEEGKIVKQTTYLNYLGEYESVLFPGDILDLCQNKVFNKKGEEVDFARRLKESKFANAKLAVEAAAKKAAEAKRKAAEANKKKAKAKRKGKKN
jgi:hypothetical protein